MGIKESKQKAKAKFKALRDIKQQERASNALRKNQSRGDGNVFTDDEISTMERAIDRNVKSS